MISCLTVTREGRLPSLRRAIADYHRQTHRARELVVVHDGSDAFHRQVDGIARAFGQHDVTVHRAPPGLRLGQLRNVAVDLARGAWICQWDDDDRYHPQRLELQLGALRADDGDFCFLTDQLHLFADTATLYWDDWAVDAPPFDVIQGTLLGRKDLLPRYPALARGEDTAVVAELAARGHRVTRLRDHGYLYVYIFDGANTWDREHHADISASKRIQGARLVRHASLLRQRLAEYDPPLPSMTMPFELGAFAFGRTEQRTPLRKAMDPQLRPRRARDLEIHPVVDGFVVYQPDRDRVHQLNHTAFVVLELCDGTIAAGELPGLVGAAFQLDPAPVADVEACLGRLLAEGLVET